MDFSVLTIDRIETEILKLLLVEDRMRIEF
jgi:hypothetical protein